MTVNELVQALQDARGYDPDLHVGVVDSGVHHRGGNYVLSIGVNRDDGRVELVTGDEPEDAAVVEEVVEEEEEETAGQQVTIEGSQEPPTGQ